MMDQFVLHCAKIRPTFSVQLDKKATVAHNLFKAHMKVFPVSATLAQQRNNNHGPAIDIDFDIEYEKKMHIASIMY